MVGVDVVAQTLRLAATEAEGVQPASASLLIRTDSATVIVRHGGGRDDAKANPAAVRAATITAAGRKTVMTTAEQAFPLLTSRLARRLKWTELWTPQGKF